MLRITIPDTESWDEEKEEFVVTWKGRTLQMEHSLISLSKWESKWHKPFLSKKGMTREETLDYIKMMTVTPNVPDDVYAHLTQENIDEITDYINAPMTATTFSDDKKGKNSREVVTAEIIYYWMIASQIDLEWEKRHLNRLLTLIRVCNIKNSTPTKRSKKEIMSQNAALNAARRKQLNSRG